MLFSFHRLYAPLIKMNTPPPEESPDRLPLTPLPAAPRRHTPEIIQSPIDDFEDPTNSIPVEDQRGFSWLANYPHDPLRFVPPISAPTATTDLSLQSVVFSS
jgi:hypothetical protein